MVLDVVRVEKGRWQDDHILIIGHLATLKGDQMKNRNVQIPYELFFQLLQYFLMENYEGEEIIRKGLFVLKINSGLFKKSVEMKFTGLGRKFNWK